MWDQIIITWMNWEDRSQLMRVSFAGAISVHI
jgi:hypothetical protein